MGSARQYRYGKSHQLKEKSGRIGQGESNTQRAHHIGNPSKRNHIGGGEDQPGTARITPEEGGASSGVRVCILCADHTRRSPLGRQAPCAGAAAIMLCRHTKKDVRTAGEIHYNKHAMSIRLVEGGLARVAGQSCLAGPSVALDVPRFGYCLG